MRYAGALSTNPADYEPASSRAMEEPIEHPALLALGHLPKTKAPAPEMGAGAL